ncbi:hypothetical protein H4R19_006327, partial [Coemansia spiralis]
KLASPAEEIKLVFLRQLKLSSFELDGKQYHSVFTGAQIVDIILGHFKLPDRKLATNVASRLVDCSLYTHVMGPSRAGGACPTPTEVLDSNAEIYTLTAEAEAALRSIRGSDGGSDGSGGLNRAKTQTRRRVRELRSHLHPRSESHSALSTPSTQSTTSIARDHSVLSSSSKESSAVVPEHQRRVHPSPSLPAPLDVRRAREAAGQRQGRDRCSVADSMSSDFAPAPGSRARRSTDSPSETLVSHGPPTAPPLGLPHSAAALDSPSTAGLTSQLQEVDIPTGCLDGLPNTWSFVVDLPGTSTSTPATAAAADHNTAIPHNPLRSSDPVPHGASPVHEAGDARASAPVVFMSSGAPRSATANHDSNTHGAGDDGASDGRREPHMASV